MAEALEKFCAHIDDGFGEIVAEEFETQEVIDGRKTLNKIKQFVGEK